LLTSTASPAPSQNKWKIMLRPALAAALLLMCPGTALSAQASPESADSADVLVLDHDFTAADEIVRIFLTDGQVYRAELSSEDVTLQLRSRFSGRRIPRIYPISDSRSPSGSSVVEIYPDEDGEYEIRPSSLQGSRIATRLRIFRDISESRRRMATIGRPGWELGIELAGGWHSGFAQSTAAPLPGNDPAGGTDIEGCFTARGAPGLQRLSLCVLGVSHQSQHGASNILWVYTEPRVRILGRARPGQSNWDLGALLRFGVGITSTNDTPVTLAPGAYLARHLRSNSGGAGWSLQASYSHAFYRGFERPFGAGAEVTPKSHRLSFGVGWYQ
jgi:hypothetical protein